MFHSRSKRSSDSERQFAAATSSTSGMAWQARIIVGDDAAALDCDVYPVHILFPFSSAYSGRRTCTPPLAALR